MVNDDTTFYEDCYEQIAAAEHMIGCAAAAIEATGIDAGTLPLELEKIRSRVQVMRADLIGGKDYVLAKTTKHLAG